MVCSHICNSRIFLFLLVYYSELFVCLGWFVQYSDVDSGIFLSNTGYFAYFWDSRAACQELVFLFSMLDQDYSAFLNVHRILTRWGILYIVCFYNHGAWNRRKYRHIFCVVLFLFHLNDNKKCVLILIHHILMGKILKSFYLRRTTLPLPGLCLLRLDSTAYRLRLPGFAPPPPGPVLFFPHWGLPLGFLFGLLLPAAFVPSTIKAMFEKDMMNT